MTTHKIKPIHPPHPDPSKMSNHFIRKQASLQGKPFSQILDEAIDKFEGQR